MKSDQHLTILHLSDLHFTADAQTRQDVRSWYDSLLGDIRQCVPNPSKQNTFVVVSGDLTRSGQPGEFANAAIFLRSLLDNLDLSNRHLLLVPGNHDMSWNRPFEERRDAFLDCVEHFWPERKSSHSLVHRFDRQGIVFLTPDTTELSEAGSAPQLWRRMQQELSGPEDDIKIAVTHRPLEWSDHLFDSHSKSDVPRLNLHGHEHGQVWDTSWYGYKKRTLSVGAGPLSCEKWRRTFSGPPVYHILAIHDKKVSVRSRLYLAQSQRWVDRGPLLTEVNSGRERDVCLQLPEAQKPNRNDLIDRLCELPEYDVALLAKDLGTAIDPYAPLRESREEFATRLVDYFEQERRLDYLGRAIFRSQEGAGTWRIRVFVAATQEAKKVATAIFQMCKSLGAEPWLAEHDLSAGANVEIEIATAIQKSDIFLVIIASDFNRSRWIAREVGIALQIATAHSPRIVPVLLPGGQLPDVLKGLDAILIKDESSIKSEVLARVLRSAG